MCVHMCVYAHVCVKGCRSPILSSSSVPIQVNRFGPTDSLTSTTTVFVTPGVTFCLRRTPIFQVRTFFLAVPPCGILFTFIDPFKLDVFSFESLLFLGRESFISGLFLPFSSHTRFPSLVVVHLVSSQILA